MNFVWQFLGLLLFPVNCSVCLSLSVCQEYETTFTGQDNKSIRIRNNGDITLVPVTIGTRTVSATTQILAPNQAAADAVVVQFYGDSSSFSLVFPWDFWNCPQQDVTATLLDSAVLIAPILLQLESLSGNIVVGDFNRLRFNEAIMTSFNSKVTMGEITIDGLLQIVTNNNEISLTDVQATSSEVTNANAAIYLTSFSTENSVITNLNAPVTGSVVTLLSSTNCKIVVSTTNAAIDLDTLTFPTTTPCQVEITNTNGDVTVSTSQFSGTYDLSAPGGEASVAGFTCATTSCSGNVPGAVAHSLIIKTTNHKISLVFSS